MKRYLVCWLMECAEFDEIIKCPTNLCNERKKTFSNETHFASKLHELTNICCKRKTHKYQTAEIYLWIGHKLGDALKARSVKHPKFEKRKMSPSPERRHLQPPSHGIRGPSPYHDSEYSGSRASPRGHFSPPPKKSLRREPDRFERGRSPSPMHHSEGPGHMEGRVPHRSGMPSRSPPPPSHHHRSRAPSSPDDRSGHFESRPRSGPPPVSKRPPPMKPYDPPHEDIYRSPSPAERYSASPEKRYVQTLHERFTSVVESNRSEPRIKYSREDLEKITIDIHRNVKEPSPPLRRHIADPSDVKLVHRNAAGARPMFDRDEIKQAARDMREDAYYEKKATSGGYPLHSSNMRDGDSYEITRHRFDPHSQAPGGRNLGRQGSSPRDQDDREREYDRQSKRSFPDERSKSRDRDFRSERYQSSDAPRGRPGYRTNPHQISESRGHPIHRKESIDMDGRKKMSSRPEPPTRSRSNSRGRYSPPPPVKHYHGAYPSRGEKHHGARRSQSPDARKWPPRRSPMSRDEEYSRKPDKYYKMDGPPRSSSYYDGSSRRSPESYRGRGGSRPFRTPRGRGRGFRGAPRGTYVPRGFRGSPYRSSYRGSNPMRGRGAPRRGRLSPGFWEHDLYAPEDRRKMDLP